MAAEIKKNRRDRVCVLQIESSDLLPAIGNWNEQDQLHTLLLNAMSRHYENCNLGKVVNRERVQGSEGGS